MNTILNDAQVIENNEFETDTTLRRCKDAVLARGHHDGRNGESADVPDSLVNAFAERYIERHWNGKRKEVAKRRTAAATKSAESGLARQDFDEGVTRSKEVEATHAAQPQKFSRAWGIFYVGLSIFLFIADFPLSLMLVADVFELKVWKPDQPLSLVFVNLTHQGWMVIFLASCIALFPIVLKIPYQHFLSLLEAHTHSKSRLKGILHWLMAGVILLMLLTLTFLAIYRDQLYKQKLADERVQEQQQLMLTQESLIGKTDAPLNVSQAQSPRTGGISDWAFIFVTLTLPFVAAVAAGEGAACIHRRKRLDDVTDKIPGLRAAYLGALEAEVAAREDLKSFEESLLNPQTTAAWREIARNQGIGYYLSAHEEGTRQRLEELKSRSLYDTIVLRADDDLSPAPGRSSSTVRWN